MGIDRNELEDFVSRNLSIRGISNETGYSTTNVRYWLERYGLKTLAAYYIKNSRLCQYCHGPLAERHQTFCSTKCQKDYRYDEYIKRWLAGDETGNIFVDGRASLSAYVRRWALERAGYKCEKCGWQEVNPFTGKVPLHVHHKDGDAEHTVPDNIEVLDPSCHSLTENYGGANRGHGRKGRYSPR